MDEERVDARLQQWYSSYGIITAERLLSTYQINLREHLLDAVKSPTSFYHRLLQVPLKNVMNGIIFEQASDYHLYAQKLFIDYLLSEEAAKDATSQGALTRESIEDERKALLLMAETFQKKRIEHNSLIATSQAALIRFTKEWNKTLEKAIKLMAATLKKHEFEAKKSEVRHALEQALIYGNLFSDSQADFVKKMVEVFQLDLSPQLQEALLTDLASLLKISLDFADKIKDFLKRTKEMNEEVCSFRTQFYQLIIRVNNLIQLLPDYRINIDQDLINRELLHFDKTIGD